MLKCLFLALTIFVAFRIPVYAQQGPSPADILNQLQRPPASTIPGARSGPAPTPGTPRGGAEIPLDGYVIPLLVRLIYEGKIELIPDDSNTRAYVTSIRTFITKNCSSSTFQAEFKEMAYFFGGGSLQLREGMDDAGYFYSQFGCVSPQGRRFRDNIDAIIAERSERRVSKVDDARFAAIVKGEIPKPPIALNEALAKQEITRVYAGVIRGSCMIRNRPACEKLIALMRSDQKIIQCSYNGVQPETAEPAWRYFWFWNGTVPADLPSYSVPGDVHPLAQIVPIALSECPARAFEAMAYLEKAKREAAK